MIYRRRPRPLLVVLATAAVGVLLLTPLAVLRSLELRKDRAKNLDRAE